MPLTTLHRRFLIDPIQDPLLQTESILVTEERIGRGIYLDKIVKVTGRAEFNNRLWWVTDSGDHVIGAPVNPRSLNYSQPVIGIYGEDLFVTGRYNDRIGNSSVLLSGVLRSDQLTIPGLRPDSAGNTESLSLQAGQWVSGAPWALSLMPTPTDSEAVTLAKMELAEQRWNYRHAKGVLRSEVLYRGWDDNLEELDDSHDMLTPTFGAVFKGDVMIRVAKPVAEALTDDADNERVTALRTRSFRAGAPHSMMVGIHMELPLDVRFQKREELDDIKSDNVQLLVRRALNDHGSNIGAYSLTPVLRSAA